MIEVFVDKKRDEIRVVDRTTQKTNTYFHADIYIGKMIEISTKAKTGFNNDIKEMLPISRTRIIYL